MRKILAATAIALSLAAPAQAQYFWGSGPGWGQGGGWNACSNCGMRGYGPGGGYYSGIAGATNGFGAGQRGWGGIPSANGYGMGWGGNALVGQTLGQFMGGGYGGGMGMMGGMGPLGILGGLFGGGLFAPGNYYPGAMAQQPGYPPANGYAYSATRYGGGGAMPQGQYRPGTVAGGYSKEIYNLPPRGYAGYTQPRPQVVYVPKALPGTRPTPEMNANMASRCWPQRSWSETQGWVYVKVCH